VLDVAYTIEFGREISQQSALSMLYFIASNRRQAFTPFGVFSDERFISLGATTYSGRDA